MIGQTIGHYEIIGTLGKGGMGTVYRAQDLKLNRTVAIKMLSGGIESREARVRFIREAQAAASLHHPRICTIHEVGEHEGSDYIVMALADGQDLRSVLSSGALGVQQALDIAIQIAEGLEFAHAHDIVHRDIKPANVMVGDDGRATIMDFGLAKLGDATAVTRSSTTLGTPWYMAPEQVRASHVDLRADLWSLGVILFEMLSGRRPFDADRLPAVMHQILTEEAPRLSDVCEGVPEELDWIVAKCLAKSPGSRYSTDGELLNDLRAARSKIPAETNQTLTVRARPRSRRSRSALRMLGATLLVVLVTVIGYRLMDQVGTPDETVREPAPQRVEWSDPPRVAVVSFENQTGDSSLDFISSLAADQISTGLASTELVEVLPLSVDATMEGSSLAALLQASAADVAVTGSFYRDGDGVMVQTRVVDAHSAGIVFSVPSVHAMREAPRTALESISQRVAGGLGLRIDNPFDIPAPAIPPTWEAFEQYRSATDLFLNEQGRGAIARLRRAAELDSLFVRPRVLSIVVLCANPMGIVYAVADTALMDLQEAGDLDEYDLEMTRMLREIVDNNYASAANVALRLAALAPGDKMVQALTVIRLAEAGRNEEALQTYYALEFEPELRRRRAIAGLNRIVAGPAHALGRFDEELRLRRELLRYFPSEPLYHLDLLMPFAAKGEIDSMQVVVEEALARKGTRGQIDFMVWTGGASTLRAHGYADLASDFVNWYLERRPDRPEDDARQIQKFNLAKLLYHAERWDDARAEFIRHLDSGELNEDDADYARLMLGYIAAHQGDRDAGEAAVEAFIADFDDPYDRSAPDMSRASVAAILGDLDEAVRHLQQAGARGAKLGHWLRHNFALQSLIGYPPFEALVDGRTVGSH